MEVTQVGVIQFDKGNRRHVRLVESSAIVEVEHVPDGFFPYGKRYRPQTCVIAVRGWRWGVTDGPLFRKLKAGFERETGLKPRYLMDALKSACE